MREKMARWSTSGRQSLPAEVWPAGFSLEGLTTDPINGRVPE
jgi:hypothetical protein